VGSFFYFLCLIFGLQSWDRRDTGPGFDEEQMMRAPPIQMVGLYDEEDYKAGSGGKGRRSSLGRLNRP
jgi:hypothetical protein